METDRNATKTIRPSVRRTELLGLLYRIIHLDFLERRAPDSRQIIAEPRRTRVNFLSCIAVRPVGRLMP